MKHKWTFEEDYTCCMYYLKYIFSTPDDQSVQYLSYNISLKLPNISRESIKMKLQNIKALCVKYNFNDGLQISPLENYTNQCHNAFYKALKDFNDSHE